MQTLDWLETHLESLDKAVETLNNDFCWSLEIIHGEHRSFVKSGESLIFSSDSREAVDAFLYGMGMSVMGIPQHLFDQLSEGMKEWCDDVMGKSTPI
jgi:hypothetical protein